MSNVAAAIAVFTSALLGSVFVCLLIERFASRLSLLDSPGARKLQIKPIPRAGGAAILIVCGLARLLGYSDAPPLIWLAGLIIFAGGFHDDRKPANSVRVKLAFQVSGIVVFLAQLLFIDHVPVELGLLAGGFVFVMINSFNLMDNMNALTAGLSLILIGAFYSFDMLGISGALAMSGALVGFLILNYPSGRIFLGDQGSQFLGFWLSAAGVGGLLRIAPLSGSLRNHSGDAFGFLFFAFLPFIADTALVIVIRKLNGVPITRGDRNHLSHQLVRRGVSPNQVPFVLGVFQVASLALSFIFLERWLS